MIHAIIIYLIIMIVLIILKPGFIYDTDKSKFKDFGTGKGKTIFSIGTFAILIAIVISIVFNIIIQRNNTNISSQQNVKYIQVPVPIQTIPQVLYTNM
jgi:hypothetical protein